MGKEKPFSHPRWNDPPIPKRIGHRELTEKQKKEADRFEEVVKNGDYEKLLKGEIKL